MFLYSYGKLPTTTTTTTTTTPMYDDKWKIFSRNSKENKWDSHRMLVTTDRSSKIETSTVDGHMRFTVSNNNNGEDSLEYNEVPNGGWAGFGDLDEDYPNTESKDTKVNCNFVQSLGNSCSFTNVIEFDVREWKNSFAALKIFFVDSVIRNSLTSVNGP